MALLPETTTLIATFSVPPSDERTAVIDDTIRALIKRGIWDKLEALYALAAHDTQAARKNWKSPASSDLTLINSPAFTQDVGYTGDGVDDYIETNIPGNAAFFTSTSAAMGIWVHSNPAPGAGQYLIAQEPVTGERIALAQSMMTGSTLGRLGSPDSESLGTTPIPSAHLTVSRNDNQTIVRYANGGNPIAAESASPSYSASETVLLRRGTSYSNATISFAYFGQGLGAAEIGYLDRILRTYLARLETNDNPYASPEQFGAAGDASLDDDGDVVGSDDTLALATCRDYCVATGKTMLLTSAYRCIGTFLLDESITVVGTDKTTSGLFLDITREIEGVNIIGSRIKLDNFFIDTYMPSGIQNGQGSFGTNITVGKQFYFPNPPKNLGESDHDYGLRISPPLAHTITIQNMWLRRRKGSGGGHSIACMSRCSGVYIMNNLCEGYSPSSGVQGSFVLTHWGTSSTVANYFTDDNGLILEPVRVPKIPGAFTYHPNNIFILNNRLRNVGRGYNHSASYNVIVDGLDIEGFVDEEGTSKTVQVASITVGDESDMFAHPDDAGKVYSNIVMRNIVGWNIDGSSPNPAGTSVFDWPGAATSKVVNTDGSLVLDLPYGWKSYDPPSLANTASATTSISVPGILIGDPVDVWFSRTPPEGYTITASVTTNGFLDATFTNNTGGTVNLGAGTLTGFYNKKRLETQPKWTGCEFSNWRFYGIGSTTNLINIRNNRAFAKFENIDARGLKSTDGLLIQQTIGRLDFRDCVLPGKSELKVVDGASFDNCSFENTDVISLTVASTLTFSFGDTVIGSDSQVEGVVYEVASGTVLRVRLAGAPWKVFVEGEILIGPGGNSTIATGGVDAFTNNTVLISGDPSTATLQVALSKGGMLLDLDGTGFPNDVRIGDKISYAGGVVYATQYADVSEDKVAITPAPAGASVSDEFTLERASRNIEFSNCEISGGRRGLEVSNSYGVRFSGGTIRDTGQYGVYVDSAGTVDLEGVTFSNNGLTRVQLEEDGSTRDVIVGAGGTLRADKLIFKDGQWVQHNLLVNGDAIGGHLRDSIFVPIGAVGAPSDSYSYMYILAGTFDQSNNRDAAGVLYAERVLSYDPPALLNGNSATKTIFVPGTRTGDTVAARFSTPLDGVTMTASVTAVDVVSVVFQNSTGSTKNLATGTLEVVVSRT